MNQRQRNIIREALELKALQNDDDTPACLEILEQVNRLEFRDKPITHEGHKAAEDLSRDCPECFAEMEIRVFPTVPGGSVTRWPYCPRCQKKRLRALSKEDARKFLQKEQGI